MKKFAFIFLVLLFILIPAFFAKAADLQDAFDTGEDSQLYKAAEQAGYEQVEDPQAALNKTVGTVIQAVLSLLGIIFLILMIYGGILWMTDRGNEQQVNRAKSLISAAIIGLVIVLGAYAISFFIIDRLTENTLTEAGSSE